VNGNYDAYRDSEHYLLPDLICTYLYIIVFICVLLYFCGIGIKDENTQKKRILSNFDMKNDRISLFQEFGTFLKGDYNSSIFMHNYPIFTPFFLVFQPLSLNIRRDHSAAPGLS
jgi:hypothetical protein